MKVKNCTIAELNDALQMTNDQHGYDLIWNRAPEAHGKWIHFTIRSRVSGVPGARFATSGRRLVSASWHAHGYLFENILELRPDAVIQTFNATICKSGGNWQDFNVGSYFAPCNASQLSIH